MGSAPGDLDGAIRAEAAKLSRLDHWNARYGQGASAWQKAQMATTYNATVWALDNAVTLRVQRLQPNPVDPLDMQAWSNQGRIRTRIYQLLGRQPP